MTWSQTILAKKLLKGFFLRRYTGRKKKGYTLFDAKVNPLEFISEKVKNGLGRFIRKDIWKRSKNGGLTLNLNVIRQLHGNCTLKKLYKKRNDLDISGSVNTKRKSSSKK